MSSEPPSPRTLARHEWTTNPCGHGLLSLTLSTRPHQPRLFLDYPPGLRRVAGNLLFQETTTPLPLVFPKFSLHHSWETHIQYFPSTWSALFRPPSISATGAGFPTFLFLLFSLSLCGCHTVWAQVKHLKAFRALATRRLP